MQKLHANDNYKHFTGTENHYRHSFTKMVYTDGVKCLVTDLQAFWLLDVIVSHQCLKKVRSEEFQVWKLERVEGDAFKVVATDGNEKVIAVQKIPYSDFKCDTCTIWVVGVCMMLPSEY